MKEKLEIQSIYNLTPMQEGMLFHSLLNPDSQAYFVQFTYTIYSDINVNILEKSMNILIQRYDILRTNFYSKDIEKPKQIVFKKKQMHIIYEDISKIKDPDKQKYIDAYIQKDKENYFDLAKDLLIRISVLKTGNKNSIVLLSFHHIIMDGWCLQTVIKELFEVYTCMIHNKPLELEDVPSYTEYIKWIEKRDKKEACKFWSEYLDNYNCQVKLPMLNFQTSAEYKQVDFYFSINRNTSKKLIDMAGRMNVTPNTILQTVWGVLLARYNNSDDVVFGIVSSGRPEEIENVEKMVGLFINTLPIRIKFKNYMTIPELVREVQSHSMESRNYEFLPLAEIQALSKLKQKLINSIYAFQNYPINKESITEVEEDSLVVGAVNGFEQTNYNLNLIIALEGDVLTGVLKYNSNVYGNDMIENVAKCYEQMLQAICMDNDIRVMDIDIVTPQEKKLILDEFNNTNERYPDHKTVHELFEEQAELNKDTIALVYHKKQYTYFELNSKANQVARLLIERGVIKGSIVGILVERSIEMIIGILAILKAGGVYLPIDTKYPMDRQKYILEDSGACAVLKPSSVTISVPSNVCLIDLEDEKIYAGRNTNLINANVSDDLAYIMYTSGTTGNPKGVMIKHKSIIRLVRNTNYIQFSKNDHLLQTGALVFDACTFEIWGALLNGLRLYIINDEEIISPTIFSKILKDNKISVLFLTSALFNRFLEQDPRMFRYLKCLLVGGEVLCAKNINRVRRENEGLKVLNAYGPTENTTFSTYYIIDKDYEDNNIPIGKPISNTTAYILDNNYKLQPVGVPGELCLGGEGLAKGYLNREELNKDRFIANPFKEGQKLYKTGDIARWLSDGNIEFIGRVDNQIKIRGYRVELGEIEHKLLNCEEVKEAVVILKEKENGEKLICAYISAHENLDISALKEKLRKQLPNYMIPAVIVVLDRLPLNQNGKIDKSLLPEPVKNTDIKDFAEPCNELEESIVEVWRQALGLDTISINDNLFEIGGHSLIIIQMLPLYSKLGIAVSINDIYSYQTPKTLAEYLGRMNNRSQNNVRDFEEAERLIFKEFKLKSQLSKFKLSGKMYVVLKIKELNQDLEQIRAFIETNFHEEIQPHYIVNLDETSLKKELIEKDFEFTDIQKSYWEVAIDNIFLEIEEKQNQFSNKIIGQKIIDEYDISPSQRYHLQYRDASGTYMVFHKYLNLDTMNEAFQSLIKEQEAMRKILVYKDGDYKTQVFQAPEKILIPMIDISIYKNTLRLEIFSRLMKDFFLKKYDIPDSLMYRVLLIKENEKDYLLLLPFSHCIFDYMSSEIIQRKISTYYNCISRDKKIKGNSDKEYRDYIQQIEKGPVNMTDKELMDRFKLRDFYDISGRLVMFCNHFNNTGYTSIVRQIKIRNKSIKSEEMLKISLKLVIEFFNKYFGVSKIPIWMTNYGRRYENEKYFETIGEFVDYIPILLNSKISVNRNMEYIKSSLEMLPEKNINFSNLIYNKKMENEFSESKDLLFGSFQGIPVNFNFLGEMIEQHEEWQSVDTGGINCEDRKRIPITAWYNSELLYFNIVLPYQKSKEKLQAILEECSIEI